MDRQYRLVWNRGCCHDAVHNQVTYFGCSAPEIDLGLRGWLSQAVTLLLRRGFDTSLFTTVSNLCLLKRKCEVAQFMIHEPHFESATSRMVQRQQCSVGEPCEREHYSLYC